MRVLAIETDTSTLSATFWIRQMHVVHEAISGQEGVEMASLYEHDVIVIDSVLPDMAGVDALRALRSRHIVTPVLAVGASAKLATRVTMLDCGADDYLTKPFHRDELFARMRALMRRSNGCAGSVVRVGELELDMARCEIRARGTALLLSRKLYQLLECLMLRHGKLVTRPALIERLYGAGDVPHSDTISQFVHAARVKIAKHCGKRCYIRRIFAEGYILEEPRGKAP